MLLFLVPFWRLVFDAFLVSCIGLSHFYLFSFKYFSGAKCSVYINLCTFRALKKNNARLQWYSCARHKAPGPLVLFVQLYLCLKVLLVLFKSQTNNTVLGLLNLLLILINDGTLLLSPAFRESGGTLKLIRPSVSPSVCQSLCHKNFNLAHIFWSINDRALIFGMHDPCDKPFLLILCGDLDLDLWPTSRSNLFPGGGTTILRICLFSLIITGNRKNIIVEYLFSLLLWFTTSWSKCVSVSLVCL